MKNGVTFLLLLSLLSCNKKVSSILWSDVSSFTKLEEEEGYKRVCSDPLNSLPDQYTTPKVLRCNVQIIDRPEMDTNFSLEEGKQFLYSLIKDANLKLGKNHKMNLPVGNVTPVIDPGYRYKVVGATDDPNDKGYYYQIEEKDYYFLQKGRNKNNYDRKIIDKFRIGGDSIINIFVIAQPPDSVKSETYHLTSTGIALGKDVKLSGLYEMGIQPWRHATMLNHEIGHIFGLAHAWRNDGCDDTPIHPNCWNESSPAPCDGTFSNNVMDYNASQMSFTPCQIGKSHKAMNTIGSRIRNTVIPDWCHLTDAPPAIIDNEVHWKGDRDLNREIIIRNGGVLHLHCRLSLPENAKIYVEGKGELHIHSYSRIHNACGLMWGGIETYSGDDVPSNVFVYGRAKIENVIEGKSITAGAKNAM